MAAQAAYNRGGLLFQYGEVMRVVGIAVAGQRELLPYEYAPVVAVLEETVLVDDASAPRTQNVEIGRDGHVNQFFVAGGVEHAWEKFGTDPVGAFGEDRAPVQFDLCRGGAPCLGKPFGFAPCAFVHHEPYAAEADAFFDALQFISPDVEQAVT